METGITHIDNTLLGQHNDKKAQMESKSTHRDDIYTLNGHYSNACEVQVKTEIPDTYDTNTSLGHYSIKDEEEGKTEVQNTIGTHSIDRHTNAEEIKHMESESQTYVYILDHYCDVEEEKIETYVKEEKLVNSEFATNELTLDHLRDDMTVTNGRRGKYLGIEFANNKVTLGQYGNPEEKCIRNFTEEEMQVESDIATDEKTLGRYNISKEEKISFEIQDTDSSHLPIEENEFSVEQYASGIGQEIIANTNKQTKKQHTRKQHICYFCEKDFLKASNLAVHMNTHTGDKPHECEICQKKFSQISNLRKHMLIHSGEKPYKCQTCSKEFRSKDHLRRHEMIHTDEKPFACEICDKQCRDSTSLRSHMRTHTQEFPYSCDVCKQQFRRPGKLETHKLKHTDKLPFSCSLCPQKYARARSYKTHMLTHTGERPYSCKSCEKKFRHKSNLDRHVMTVHTCKEGISNLGDLNKEPQSLVESGISKDLC